MDATLSLSEKFDNLQNAQNVNEVKPSNAYFKIEFKQKNEVYKSYAYFWANHEHDLKYIQAYFKPDQCKPKVKFRFYSFKPEQPVMACCVKVPLEKTAPFIGFLYQNQILKERDFTQAAINLANVRNTMALTDAKSNFNLNLK